MRLLPISGDLRKKMIYKLGIVEKKDRERLKEEIKIRELRKKSSSNDISLSKNNTTDSRKILLLIQ